MSPLSSQSVEPNPSSTHIDLKSHFSMLTRNWILPHFLDNYRRERDSNDGEYCVELWRKWEFRMNESNALHDNLVRLGAPPVDRILFTLPWQNMHQYECLVAKIKKKENYLMLLRRCMYHMLQLAEELAVVTNRQLIPTERNNVLNYEDYLSE